MLPDQQTNGMVHGRPGTARTTEYVDAVEALVSSQVGRPDTHRTISKISRETGLFRRKWRHNFN